MWKTFSQQIDLGNSKNISPKTCGQPKKIWFTGLETCCKQFLFFIYHSLQRGHCLVFVYQFLLTRSIACSALTVINLTYHARTAFIDLYNFDLERTSAGTWTPFHHPLFVYQFLHTRSIACGAVGQTIFFPSHVRGFDPVTILIVIIAEKYKILY